MEIVIRRALTREPVVPLPIAHDVRLVGDLIVLGTM
jgi:hypothetical protein